MSDPVHPQELQFFTTEDGHHFSHFGNAGPFMEIQTSPAGIPASSASTAKVGLAGTLLNEASHPFNSSLVVHLDSRPLCKMVLQWYVYFFYSFLFPNNNFIANWRS